MPQTLDFNKITYDTITVTKGEHSFVLRDDVPMAVLVRVFGLQAMGERIKAETAKLDPATATAAEAQLVLERAYRSSEAEALEVFGLIVRHTPAYKEWSDERLAALFSYEEQGAVISAFFTHRLGASNGPLPATNDGGEVMEQEAAPGVMERETTPSSSPSLPASPRTMYPVVTPPM